MLPSSSSSPSSACMSTVDFIDALKRACDSNSLIELRELIHAWKSSQSVNEPTSAELSQILAHAATHNRPEMVRFLIEVGAELNRVLDKCLSTKNLSTDIWDVFVDKGLDFRSFANSTRFDDAPPLRYVLHSETLTSWFLSHGADPNSVDIQGTTILAWAAFSTSVPIISVLASKGARLEGSRALYAAACSKRPEQISILGFLLDQGMDVNSLQLELPWTVAQHMRPSVRGTALHAAEKFGHRHLVEFLLGRGADPEVRNSEGKTPAEVGESAKKSGMSKRGWAKRLCSVP